MKKCIFFILLLISIVQTAKTQTVTWNTSGCGAANPNLQMIVYQGCTNTPTSQNEGMKEFVHFTTGTNSWNVADLAVTGSQNSTNAPFGPCSYAPGDFYGNLQATTALNNIAGCSPLLFALAPATIPPNSKVIIIPNVSGAFSAPPYSGITTADLAPLCGKGPIYVIGATAKPGCTGGIFANKNAGCVTNCNRNIVINFGGGCIATINYDINDPAAGSAPNSLVPGCGTNTGQQFSQGDCFPKPCEIPNVTVNIDPNSKLCANAPQNINFTLNTNAPVGSSYSWTGPNGWTSSVANPTVNNPGFSAGNYEYKVTICAPGGCMKVSSVTVTISNNNLNANITAPTSVCKGALFNLSVTGAPTGSTYSWSGPNGFSSALQNPSGIDSQSLPSGANNYTLTVSNGTCSTTLSTIVNVNANAISSPIITGALSFCQNTPTTLSTSNSYSSYQWSNGAMTPSITTAESGLVGLTVTDANGCKASSSVILNASPSPSPSIVGNSIVCLGKKVQLSTSTPFNIYSWSNGANTPEINVAAGTYILTVTNSFGCTGIAARVINQVALPIVAVTGNTTFCEGETSILVANPSNFSSYFWQNGNNSPTLSVSTSGTYVVTVSDANGCTTTASTTVTMNPKPIPAITGVISICAGASTTLDAGAGFSTYLWHTGAKTPTITVSQAGAVGVTVTDANGCRGTDAKTITQSGALIFSILGKNTFCEGETTTLDAGAGFSTYQWNTGATSQKLTVNSTGTYSVSVTNGACSGSAVINVTKLPKPVFSITGAATFCQGQSVLLSISNTFNQFLWNNGSLNSSITVSVPNTYAVTVTDNNGCSASAAKTVSQAATPNVTISGSDKICSGSAGTSLSATPPATSYLWSNGNTTSSINANLATTYGVTVTNSSGCTASATKTLTLASNFVTQLNTAICEGNTYFFNNKALDKSGIYQQTLNAVNGCDSVIRLNLTVLKKDTVTTQSTQCTGVSGISYVTLKKQNGCDSVLQKVVTVVATTAISITQQGNVLTVSPQSSGVTYQWFFNGQPIAGANGAVFTQFVDGAYHVETTTLIAGCKTKSNVIEVGKIATNDKQNATIRIFPNPTSGMIYIENTNYKIYNIQLINTLGQKQTLSFSQNSVDISIFPKGIYLLQISSESVEDSFFKVMKL